MTNQAEQGSSTDDSSGPGPAQHVLHEMLRIRRFEDRCVQLYGATSIRGFMHLCTGQEAVAVGVMQALERHDAVVSTYRDHGHALARGTSARALMAEMFGKVTGPCRGRGGSMHIFDVDHRFYGGNAIVAGGIPVAAGIALADKLRGQPGITACFFGDGAVAEGPFHETMNLAALWRLPILFCCENNYYAMGTALHRAQSVTDLTRKAAAYDVAAWAVDGMDVSAVEDAARRAAAMVRSGSGPVFLELRTYRFRAHSMYDSDRYRPRHEIDAWRSRDPLDVSKTRMVERGWLDDATWSAMVAEVDAEIDDAVAFAEASPTEAVHDLERFVYTEVDG